MKKNITFENHRSPSDFARGARRKWTGNRSFHCSKATRFHADLRCVNVEFIPRFITFHATICVRLLCPQVCVTWLVLCNKMFTDYFIRVVKCSAAFKLKERRKMPRPDYLNFPFRKYNFHSPTVSRRSIADRLRLYNNTIFRISDSQHLNLFLLSVNERKLLEWKIKTRSL